jgi:hypothetical protein
MSRKQPRRWVCLNLNRNLDPHVRLLSLRFRNVIKWFCGGTFMSGAFQFVVSDTFLIEGRGLILSPFFPVDRYRFDTKERVSIETPDGRLFEADANFEIPFVSPRPKVFQAMCVIRQAQKTDVPVGSKVSLLNKTSEQVAPNAGSADAPPASAS